MNKVAVELAGRIAAVQDFCRRLLMTDWSSPKGPMRLNPGLDLKDLADSAFFKHARLFLAMLHEEGGTPATATGNLNRMFVRKVFERMELPEPLRHQTLELCKKLDEMDLWGLHLARVVCECARLTGRRNKRFHVTRAGRELLADAKAGLLFCKIFLAHFGRFDLRYNYNLRDVPSIQQSIAIIFWRLDSTARRWTPVRGIVPQIVLPQVQLNIRESMRSPYDTEEGIISGYVLNPLFTLGLIERRKGGDWPCIRDEDSIRTTALWRKFLSFDELTVPPGAMNGLTGFPGSPNAQN